VDESGSHIALTRPYGRAPKGQRVVGRVPRNRGKVTTMLGMLGIEGMDALMTVEGGTTKKVFGDFVAQHMVPVLGPQDVVLLDNLGAHHAKGVRAAIEATGARVIYLPPYHPDLNPIELAWSKLKQILRDLGARTKEALIEAIAEALERITGSDALGWFLHCGYRAPRP
jgi:transposase